MVFHREAWRREPGEVARAAFDVKDPLALHALEVVMVPPSGHLEARVLSGQIDGFEQSIGEQRLEIPVDGRNAQAGGRSLRRLEDFLGQQGTAGPRDGIEDRGALAGVAFHIGLLGDSRDQMITPYC